MVPPGPKRVSARSDQFKQTNKHILIILHT